VQDSRRRVWIDARQMRFGSIDELNAWAGERCRQLCTEVKHPEHKQFSVAEMLGELHHSGASIRLWSHREASRCRH